MKISCRPNASRVSSCILYLTTLLAGNALATELSETIDFNRNIASILHENCSGCHRNGQSGPFELIEYSDVKRHAETIRVAIEERYMPPWKPVDVGIQFSNHRGLSQQQIDLIVNWIDQGCIEGSQEFAPQPPQYPGGWMLGQPDMVVRMQEPFTVPADGPDIYRSFVMPISLTEDKWIKAIELRPQARGVVHHVLYFMADSKSVRSRRHRDGLPGFPGMNFLRSSEFLQQGPEALTRGLGAYVPGAVPNLLPGDLARLLPAGHDIILQTHFHPSGRVEVEQSELAIYFTNKPPSHTLIPLQVPPLFGLGAGIDIPPGDDNFTITDTVELPVDVKAVEIGGHAHYICTKMNLQATLPSGESLTLLRIDEWDLDWQDQYLFATPMELPKGTRLTVEISYDNSDKNPENPFSPPQRISWGQQSTDEMGSVVLLLTAKDETDAPTLSHFVAGQNRQALQKRIRSQSGLMAAFGNGAVQRGRLLTVFDHNSDGVLDASEIPERMRDRFLDLFDENEDGTLDAVELEKGFEMIRQFVEDRG